MAFYISPILQCFYFIVASFMWIMTTGFIKFMNFATITIYQLLSMVQEVCKMFHKYLLILSPKLWNFQLWSRIDGEPYVVEQTNFC